MGQIGDGLYGSFKQTVFKFIQNKGENDGNRKSKNKTINADKQGIFHQSEKIKTGEKLDKMFKPNPSASQYPPAGAVILKGYYHPVHGEITEQDIISQNRDKHDNEGLVPPYVFKVYPPLGIDVFPVPFHGYLPL
jgi:hypothetical protein